MSHQFVFNTSPTAQNLEFPGSYLIETGNGTMTKRLSKKKMCVCVCVCVYRQTIQKSLKRKRKCNFNYWGHDKQGLPTFSQNILQGKRTLGHSQFDVSSCPVSQADK